MTPRKTIGSALIREMERPQGDRAVLGGAHRLSGEIMDALAAAGYAVVPASLIEGVEAFHKGKEEYLAPENNSTVPIVRGERLLEKGWNDYRDMIAAMRRALDLPRMPRANLQSDPERF